MKRCNDCGQTKNLSEFYRRKCSKDGYRYDCKACSRKRSDEWAKNNPDSLRVIAARSYTKRAPKVIAANMAYRKKHPTKKRESELKLKYGITLNTYNEMLEAQSGLCAVCRQPPNVEHRNPQQRLLRVDHCHQTKKIRGLLCDRCNRAIGLLGDSAERLTQAALYISENERIWLPLAA